MRETILLKWAKEWSTLRAWCRDLSDVQVTISSDKHPKRLGTCWAHGQRLIVYVGASITQDLATLLHELAHAATIGENHDTGWQGIYSDAVEEVTGIALPSIVPSYHLLDQAAEDAVKWWWSNSSNEFAYNLLRKRV